MRESQGHAGSGTEGRHLREGTVSKMVSSDGPPTCVLYLHSEKAPTELKSFPKLVPAVAQLMRAPQMRVGLGSTVIK